MSLYFIHQYTQSPEDVIFVFYATYFQDYSKSKIDSADDGERLFCTFGFRTVHSCIVASLFVTATGAGSAVLVENQCFTYKTNNFIGIYILSLETVASFKKF